MKIFGAKIWLIIPLFLSGVILMSFNSNQGGDDKEVHWMNFNDVVKLEQKKPKKIFIDVYTQWCGWCKKMDQSTYTDPEIIAYLNKNFYCVRLDAETGDTFHFNNHEFTNPKPHTRGYTNELASSLLDGKLGYPTTVYLDEKFGRLTFLQTYVSVDDLKPILKYFAENKYQSVKFEDFKKSEQKADSIAKAK
jgi:thioredoxin-related protein